MMTYASCVLIGFTWTYVHIQEKRELHANVRRMDNLASYRAKHYIEIVLLAS